MSTWDDVIGHEWAVTLLRGAILHDRVGHAYLITGPPQVGRTTLARTFAQALNCEAAAAARPCGHCRACKLIAMDRHPDVRVAAGEPTGRGHLSIKIDQIRELQQDLNLAPYEARYKIAIVRDFDNANPNAANAFLKTLEEPPRNVILLLTASEGDSLLSTIVSRCRVVALRPLPAETITGALRGRWNVLEDRARLLSHLADGRLGWAVEMASNDGALAEREAQVRQLHEALGGNRIFRFQMADRLARSPEELPGLLQTWVSWWRDLTLLAHNGAARDNLTNIDQRDHLQRVAASWHRPVILQGLRQTQEALWQLEHNANARLVVENLFLNYPLPATT